MKIKVKEIPREGLEIDENISAAVIGLSGDDLKVVSPLQIRGVVHKARDTVNAALEVAGEYDFFVLGVWTRCGLPEKMILKFMSISMQQWN